MSKTVINKHIASSTGGYTSSDLQPGEIGINYLDGAEAIYIKNSNNEIIPFATSANVHNTIASGSKVLICNASKTETGKTVTDSSVNVEDGTMVTVMFINGHSGKSTGEYISLSVNGIKGNIVSSKRMDSSSYTYMPAFISPNSVLSFVYYNKLWYLVGNPIIAHSYCYDSSFYYFYNIWGNRLMMYTIHQISNNASLGVITFKFPIIFNADASVAAVAAGNGPSNYLTGWISRLKKDSLQIQFNDESGSNKGNGCIIVAGLI